MWPTFVVRTAAWLEILVGVSFIAVLHLPCRLLFAVTPEGLAHLLGRFAGVGLVSLGIACLPSKTTGPQRKAVIGLLVFILAAMMFFVSVGVASTFRGIFLWPAVVLHGAIAVAIVSLFFTAETKRE